MERVQDLTRIRESLTRMQYEYVRPLSSGAFGSVHLVFSVKYQQEFVVKCIQGVKCSQIENNPEIKSLLMLCHPNIVEMYDYWQEADCIFIVFEYCNGGNMHDIIVEHGALPFGSLLSYTKQIMSAIQFCHTNGISHSDIKPQNIIIDKHGRAKLADFGLSQIIQGGAISAYFHGSPLSLAPEVLKKVPYDPFKADIWSLGVTFYIMATGHAPWKASSRSDYLNQIVSGTEIYYGGVNPEYSQFLQYMMDIEPSRRHTAVDLLSFKMFEDKSLIKKTNSGGFSSHLCCGFSKKSKRLRFHSSMKSILTFG